MNGIAAVVIYKSGLFNVFNDFVKLAVEFTVYYYLDESQNKENELPSK